MAKGRPASKVTAREMNVTYDTRKDESSGEENDSDINKSDISGIDQLEDISIPTSESSSSAAMTDLAGIHQEENDEDDKVSKEEEESDEDCPISTFTSKTSETQHKRCTSPKKTSADVTPKKVVSRKNAPKKITPKKTTPKRTRPEKVTLKKVTPQKVTLKKVTPQKVTPKKATSKRAAANKNTPRKTTIKGLTPKKGIAMKHTPKKLNKKNDEERPKKAVQLKDKKIVTSPKSPALKKNVIKPTKKTSTFEEKILGVISDNTKPMSWLAIRKQVLDNESSDDGKNTSNRPMAIKKAMTKAISKGTVVRPKEFVDFIGLRGKFMLPKKKNDKIKLAKVKESVLSPVKRVKLEINDKATKKAANPVKEPKNKKKLPVRRSVSSDSADKGAIKHIKGKTYRRSKSSDMSLKASGKAIPSQKAKRTAKRTASD